MRIAQIAPLCEAVPPQLYGGTERVVSHLVDALVELGQDVTLFASADACTRAELVPMRDKALRLDPEPLKSDLASHLTMLRRVRERAHEFDILHFHTELLHFPIFEDIAHRTLTTLHNRLDLKDLDEVYRHWDGYPLVSISDNQRSPLPFANWQATVYHGLDATLYPFKQQPQDDYLAFLGRISPEKRPDRAIAIAKQTGLRLKIAAKIDSEDRAYFDREIKPLLESPLVEYIGEIGDAEKGEFLGNARALLFPIDWPEPFGIVMIEAMACGTPVIAWRCGSVPEVLQDDVTGLIVDTEAQAVEAVYRAERMDRRAVRAEFERRFSAERMAAAYLDQYRRLLEAGEQPPRDPSYRKVA